MKALLLKRYGGIDALELAEMPRPTIEADEILVRVHAAGINPVDAGIAKGKFKPLLKFALPATMGSDLAGVVVEAGSRVTRFKPGDAVFASTFELDRGSFADFVAVPEHAAAPKPPNLDFVQAASLPMVSLTAWQALTEHLRIRPGQKVFIPAGSGGVGSIAIQLAKHLGATVATSTSTGNVEMVRGLGADEVVDYKRQEVEAVLHGVDAVLGTNGGDALEKAMQVVEQDSRVASLVGPPDVAFAKARGMNVVMRFLFGLLSRKIRALASRHGASYSFVFVRSDGQQLAHIGELLSSGAIHPVIDRVFPFAEAKEALAYLEQGRAKGKVVLRMADD